MGRIKDIIKVLLVVQLVTFALSHYINSDVETIDFDSPTQPSRDQLIVEAAIRRGMDGEAVAELLRTKTPVVRTTTSPDGVTKTTTYKLEPDGSISSKSILQKKKSYVYNSGSLPDNLSIDDLKNSPTGKVTRTYTDSDGHQVTQTFQISKPKATPPVQEYDPSGDWFGKPSWPEYQPPTGSVYRTYTRTFTGPNGERKVVQQSSNPTTYYQPEFTPFNAKPKHPSTGSINWPTFGDPFFPDLSDTSNPEDGWEEMTEPETETTTQKKTFQARTPKTWEWPEFPTHPTPTTSKTPITTSTTTTTTAPKLFIEPEPTTLRSIPNLEDFLKSQYGPQGTQTTTKTTTSKSTKVTTTPSTTSTTAKVINVEDLPVTEVLFDGKPADENVLKLLPPHLTPQTRLPPEQVVNIEHKHPIEQDVELYTPKVEKSVRTYTATHTGTGKPTMQDFDPQMQEILKRAGIKPEDISNIDGDTITKTRTEPDGRVITTTYKVNSVPVVSTPLEHKPVQHHYTPPHATTFDMHPLTPHLSPIAEFLAQLGLTKFDISSRNGNYAKTFIDENGDVLTATFVLSSPRSAGSEGKPKPNPLK